VSSQFTKRSEKILIIDQRNLYNYLCLLIPEFLEELKITEKSFKVKQYKTCQKCKKKEGILILNNSKEYKCYNCASTTLVKKWGK